MGQGPGSGWKRPGLPLKRSLPLENPAFHSSVNIWPRTGNCPPAPLQDSFGRQVNYVRVSLTEHCNFRCTYCSPAEGTPTFDRNEYLQGFEYDRLFRVFAGLGVSHVRFTGGEPLIHPGLLQRIESARNGGIAKLSLSTNGYLLKKLSRRLVEAGVSKLNVSLDSLREDRFASITRGGKLIRVLQGLEAAAEAGFQSIKLNVVLQRHGNFDELNALVRYAAENRFDIQFIETMPLGQAGRAAQDGEFLPVAEARDMLAREFPLRAIGSAADQGPSRNYQVDGAEIRLGFISPVSDNFCGSCNRVRLTATGRLIFCLGQEAGMDLLPLIRAGADDASLAEAIRARVWLEKPERHYFNDDPGRSSRVYMMRLGG